MRLPQLKSSEKQLINFPVICSEHICLHIPEEKWHLLFCQSTDLSFLTEHESKWALLDWYHLLLIFLLFICVTTKWHMQIQRMMHKNADGGLGGSHWHCTAPKNIVSIFSVLSKENLYTVFSSRKIHSVSCCPQYIYEASENNVLFAKRIFSLYNKMGGETPHWMPLIMFPWCSENPFPDFKAIFTRGIQILPHVQPHMGNGTKYISTGGINSLNLETNLNSQFRHMTRSPREKRQGGLCFPLCSS